MSKRKATKKDNKALEKYASDIVRKQYDKLWVDLVDLDLKFFESTVRDYCEIDIKDFTHDDYFNKEAYENEMWDGLRHYLEMTDIDEYDETKYPYISFMLYEDDLDTGLLKKYKDDKYILAVDDRDVKWIGTLETLNKFSKDTMVSLLINNSLILKVSSGDVKKDYDTVVDIVETEYKNVNDYYRLEENIGVYFEEWDDIAS